jgi:hypothetical protein
MSKRFDFSGCSFCRRAVDVRHHYSGALFGKEPGHLAPDSSTRTGDNSYFIS